jgi:hypothetical protein
MSNKSSAASAASESKTIHNLAEFLDWRGCGDDPYSWARAYYKYTDCGPRVVFLTKGDPAYARVATLAVGLVKGKLSVVHKVEDHDAKNYPTAEDLQLLGFEEDGSLRRCVARSLKAYRALVANFIAKEHDASRCTLTLHEVDPRSGEPDRRVWITIREEIPAEVHEVYYEDLRKENPPVVNNDNCVGLKVGSIVEGSDVEYSPDQYLFPFETAEFERNEQGMEEFTSFYWERDNSAWYEVRVGDRDYHVHNTWGEIKWEEDKPSRKIVKAVEALLATNPDIPRIPSYWSKPQPDWKPLPVTGTTATIHEYCNDTVF